MITFIDIGNSRTKLCCKKNFNSTLFSEIKTVNNERFNEAYYQEHLKDTKKIIVANVASNTITKQLSLWCDNNKIIYKEVYSEKVKGDVVSAYDQPEHLGVDRWLTLVATSQLYPNKNVLIIDAGTATTIDLLAKSGQHLGGWILAGLSTLFTSVLKETVKVKAKVVDQKSLSFGTNTTSNVNNACWAATIGFINQAIVQAENEITHLDEIIITGGNGKALQVLVNREITLIDELVFYGLNSYC